IKIENGNEIALRLIIGYMNVIAGRLDVTMVPLFVQNNMHYYKIYDKVLVKTDTSNNMGYILHCKKCGNRQVITEVDNSCQVCNSKPEHAGPLWIGSLYDRDFLDSMLAEERKLQV